MRQDALRLREGFIDIPQRAGAADAREVKVGRRLALGNIAGAVDADEEERHAARAGFLQGAETVARGFETDAELLAQHIDVVAAGLGPVAKGGIRQKQRAGEIIGKADAGETARGFVRQRPLRDDPIDRLTLLEEGHLRGHLKHLLAGMQAGGQAQHARFAVEVAQGVIGRAGDDADAVACLQTLRQCASHIADGQFGFEGDPFGRLVEFGDVVVFAIEEVAHFLEWRRDRRGRVIGCAILPVVAKAGGKRGRLFQRPTIAPVQSDEGAADGGHGIGQFAHVGQGDRFAQRRIGERFPEIGDEAGFVVFGEQLHIDAEGGVEFEQDRNSERALIVLDLVEIAERQADGGGERLLGHLPLLAQPLEPHADEGLLHGNLRASQTLQILMQVFANLRIFSSLPIF